jgi:hypothetical protein
LEHQDSARFDNPQFSIQFFPLQSGGQGANRFQQIFARGFARQSQHGDAGIIAGPEMQRIGKIQVERKPIRMDRAELRVLISITVW